MNNHQQEYVKVKVNTEICFPEIVVKLEQYCNSQWGINNGMLLCHLDIQLWTVVTDFCFFE